MRVFVVVGIAVVALGAALVPLPWSVVNPTDLLPVAAVVDITIDPRLDAAAGVSQRAVSGEYLTAGSRERATAIRLLAAAADPQSTIERPGRALSAGDVHPLVTATMAGLGIVPRYADASELPVTVSVGPHVDPTSLGAALYAFDHGSDLDVAQGRRIAGVGRVGPGGELVCTAGVTASVRAAADAAVDVVVVPSPCGGEAADSLPAGTATQLLQAPMLVGAAEALLGAT